MPRYFFHSSIMPFRKGRIFFELVLKPFPLDSFQLLSNFCIQLEGHVLYLNILFC